MSTINIESSIGQDNASVHCHLLEPGNKLPLVVEPAAPDKADLGTLLNWISNQEDIEKKLAHHGAMLFRGFEVKDAWDFEKTAKAIDPDLKNDYLGTSPRNLKTDYVFSASELPSLYPIPQHIEMSFLKFHPRKLFFYCAVEPQTGGETPIVDFREIYKQMDPKIREEFERKGIKNIRNYNGPKSRGSKIDLFKLKRWDEMFLTTDRQKVEDICKGNELECVWKGSDNLALINEQEAFKTHPVTGEHVWFNHLQVFHLNGPAIEYRHIAKRQHTLRSSLVSLFLSLVTSFKTRMIKPEDQAMHCTFRDGSEIPLEYVQHLEDLIWENMVFFQWKKGDMIAIDNYNTSHGRMPYKGPREILVCWAA